MAHVTHYALGASTDSPCGRTSMWHAGLAYTRKPERATCRLCRRWLARAEEQERKD